MDPRATRRREAKRRRAVAGSVLAALVFWGSIRLSDRYTHVETIDLEYVLPVGTTFAQDPPATVEASVTATGWDLLRETLLRGNRRIRIDSVDIRSNPDGIIELRREMGKAFRGKGLQVDAIANPRIVVRTEAIASKTVPLVLRSSIGYAVGFSAAGAPLLDFDSVLVTGPRSRVRQLESWSTDSLTLRNLRDSTSVRLAVARDGRGAFEVEPKSIRVTVGVQEYTERSLDVALEIVGYEGPDSVSVFPSVVRVTSAVGLEDYERLTPDGYRVVVEYDASGKDIVRELPVILKEAPSYTVTTTVEPRTVEAFLVRRMRPSIPSMRK